MPEHEKLLHAPLPEALEAALDALNRAYDAPEQLLQADVSAFEALSCCVFAYFDRDDVFYVNRAARRLLTPQAPACDPSLRPLPPIFWLDEEPAFIAADRAVSGRGQPLFGARELVTLAWGKTWFNGAKFAIQSVTGRPLAILFAGNVVAPSQQIRHVAKHYQTTLYGLGEN